jgi:catechol-2,3-dioxygenase
VDGVEAVMAAKARLERAGVEVRGVVDHGFIHSIYFFDPNGLRLELTTRTEKPGFLAAAAREAREARRMATAEKQTEPNASSEQRALGSGARGCRALTRDLRVVLAEPLR